MRNTRQNSYARQIVVLSVAIWLIAAVIVLFHTDAKAWELFSEFTFNAVVVGLTFGSASVIGNFIKRVIGENSEGLEGFLVATGLGLGADILLLFALGMIGLLYKPIIIAIIGVPLIFSVRRTRNFLESRSWDGEVNEIRFSAIEGIAVVSLVIVGVFVFLRKEGMKR